MSSALPNPTPNPQVASDINRRYEEFRTAALQIIGARIERVLEYRELHVKRLGEAQKEAEELPRFIAAFDQELAYLRSLGVAHCAPLVIGTVREDEPRGEVQRALDEMRTAPRADLTCTPECASGAKP